MKNNDFKLFLLIISEFFDILHHDECLKKLFSFWKNLFQILDIILQAILKNIFCLTKFQIGDKLEQKLLNFIINFFNKISIISHIYVLPELINQTSNILAKMSKIFDFSEKYSFILDSFIFYTINLKLLASVNEKEILIEDYKNTICSLITNLTDYNLNFKV